MEALLISAGLVALAEIGDKSMLLALALAARYRKPWPVAAGMLIATLLNHALAGIVGAWLAATLSPEILRWIVALSFIVMGCWVLIPDKHGHDDVRHGYNGAFLTTLVLYFLVEMGDKTQLATAALVARFEVIVPVVAGTTLGMSLVNLPVIFAGSYYAARLPLQPIRIVCALLFVTLGITSLVW